jgi:hypothetical protein
VIDDHVILLDCRAPPIHSVRALPLCPTGLRERLVLILAGDFPSPSFALRRKSEGGEKEVKQAAAARATLTLSFDTPMFKHYERKRNFPDSRISPLFLD